MAPVFAGLPLGPRLLSIESPSKWTFFPSILTVIEPGATNLAGPWQLAEIRPPPVPLLAISPMLSNVASDRDRVAFDLTVVEYSFGESSDLVIFGNGEPRSAGGPAFSDVGNAGLRHRVAAFVDRRLRRMNGYSRHVNSLPSVPTRIL